MFDHVSSILQRQLYYIVFVNASCVMLEPRIDFEHLRNGVEVSSVMWASDHFIDSGWICKILHDVLAWDAFWQFPQWFWSLVGNIWAQETC